MSDDQGNFPEIIGKLSKDFHLPDNLITWLGKLSTFQGVPFNYLVADERFLPPESIKFFQVDNTWRDALLDGALSIGRHYDGSGNASMSVVADRAHRVGIIDKTARMTHAIRKRQLKMTPEADPPPASSVTGGFLLRSKAVSGWKSMDVAAYASGSSPYDYEQQRITADQIQALQIYRLERLSADVLFGLFGGPLYELVLHQPPEAIHFGFSSADLTNGNVTKDIRVPDSDWDNQQGQFTADPLHDMTLSNVFWDTNNRVLNMSALSVELAKTLAANNKAPGYYMSQPTDTNFKNRLLSSDFAIEMVQGVGLVSFINTTNPPSA